MLFRRHPVFGAGPVGRPGPMAPARRAAVFSGLLFWLTQRATTAGA